MGANEENFVNGSEVILRGDFFEVVQERTDLLAASFSFYTMGVCIMLLLVLAIIWFEQNENGDKQIFVNKLVLSVCWSVLGYCLFVHPGTWIRFFTRPFPEHVCLGFLVLRKAVIMQMLLFYDFIILARYVFIFWLKNPLAVKEEFWWIFLNAWVIGASFITQFVWAMLPGQQPLEFYFCTGQDPTEPYRMPLKTSGVIEAASFIMVVYVQIRVQWYKKKNLKIVPNAFQGKLLQNVLANWRHY